MDISIAQAAALTCHLNARHRGIRPRALFAGNSACRDCESIEFRRSGRGWFGQDRMIAAVTADEWIDEVVGQRLVRALLIHHANDTAQVPARIASSFANNGRWLIRVEHARGSECWRSTWRVR